MVQGGCEHQALNSGGAQEKGVKLIEKSSEKENCIPVARENASRIRKRGCRGEA